VSPRGIEPFRLKKGEIVALTIPHQHAVTTTIWQGHVPWNVAIVILTKVVMFPRTRLASSSSLTIISVCQSRQNHTSTWMLC
jgi:hypothetical protein